MTQTLDILCNIRDEGGAAQRINLMRVPEGIADTPYAFLLGER
jgi:hypothetical protein